MHNRYLFLLLTFFVVSGTEAQCWKLRMPSFPHETINQIFFSDANNGYLAVNAGIIGRTTDGGDTWVPIETPVYENLTSVTAVATDAWATGCNGVLLHSTDNGFHWSVVNLSDVTFFKDVSFPARDTGFICGDSSVFRTVNRGSTWTRQTFAGTHALSYIRFFNKDTGCAYSNGKLFKTNNGGNSWTTVNTAQYVKVSFVNKNVGYAVSDSLSYDNYYKTIDGGINWVKTNTVQSFNHQPVAISVVDTAHVFILNNGTGSGNARVYYTTDGGQSWLNNNYIPQINWATAIFFTSVKTGFVSDLWGSCRKTYDRSLNWATPVNDYNGSGMAIYAQDSMHVWQTGSVYQKKTTDGGKSWSESITNSSNSWLKKLQFRSLTQGYAMSDYYYLYTTSNGGTSWAANSTLGTINDFCFATPSFGIATKNGALWRTYNSGTSWTSQSFSSTLLFGKIVCADSLHWYVSCYNTSDYTTKIYRSGDAGTTWVSGTALTASSVYSMVAVDTNVIQFIEQGGRGIYISTDGGKNFSYSGNITPDIFFSKLSSANATSSILISNENDISLYGWINNQRRIWIHNSTGWQVSPIHASFPFTDIHYIDTNTAWLTTSFGTIYQYYPSGKCPPDILAPFLNTAAIKTCSGTNASVTIANYTSYNLPYDTLRAKLMSGSSVIWSGAPSSSGVLTVPVPSTTGTYKLIVTVINPQIPNGISTEISVASLAVTTPNITPWYSDCGAGCCQGDDVGIGVGSSSALGSNYSLELHELGRNIADSIIARDETSTTLTSVMDTIRLFYKVIVGNDVCSSTPVCYSDTITYNINPPHKATAMLTASSVNKHVCSGTNITFTTTTNNAGTYGRVYNFYSINNGGTTALYSGADSFISVQVIDSVTVFCKMYPGVFGCNLPDTAITDTMTFYSWDVVKAHAYSSADTDSICKGGTLILGIDTNTVNGFNKWYLYKSNNIVTSVIDSGYVLQTTDSNADSSYVYFFTLYFDGGCSITSDTVHPIVMQPKHAIITLNSSGDLLAYPPNGYLYNWYRNTSFFAATTGPQLPQPPAGIYTVNVTTPDSCLWLGSDTLQVYASVSGIANDKRWSVYPNPANDVIWVHAPGNYNKAFARIFNMEGTLVSETLLTGKSLFSINVSQLPAGTYQLKILEGEDVAVFKLILLPH